VHVPHVVHARESEIDVAERGQAWSAKAGDCGNTFMTRGCGRLVGSVSSTSTPTLPELAITHL
jgi:hypothetical protein